MNLLNSKAEYIEQEKGLNGIYKQIEKAGRTCYKSEDKMTEDSAYNFVQAMIKSNHTAMLEHGTVYLIHMFSGNFAEELKSPLYKYKFNKYSKYVSEQHRQAINLYNHFIYVTTNYRVLVENNWLDDLKYQCEPTGQHERRYTFRFTCDRGVSHELVRHRVFSFAQESTRYCNYSKDKYDNNITFIIPTWLEDRIEEGKYTYNDTMWYKDGEPAFDADIHNDRNLFLWGINNDEDYYMKLINEFNWKPQQARQILPNALKTEIVMTGFKSDWDAFFDLRYKQSTGAVHPDMLNLTTKLREIYEILDTGGVRGVLHAEGKDNTKA